MDAPRHPSLPESAPSDLRSQSRDVACSWSTVAWRRRSMWDAEKSPKRARWQERLRPGPGGRSCSCLQLAVRIEVRDLDHFKLFPWQNFTEAAARGPWCRLRFMISADDARRAHPLPRDTSEVHASASVFGRRGRSHGRRTLGALPAEKCCRALARKKKKKKKNPGAGVPWDSNGG